MAFPLAHPAAVLPLRRFSSKHLNFTALLIGAVVPDLSYCAHGLGLGQFAHTLRGCFGFSLPVGWLAMLIFYGVGEPLLKGLPAPHRDVLLPACRRNPGEWWYAAPISLLIGALTHVFWDGFTHDTGWFVERSSFLQTDLFRVEGYHFRMYRLLWHLSSWTGLALLVRVYVSAVKRSTGSAKLYSAREKRSYLKWAAILMLPLAGVLPFGLYNLAKGSWTLRVLANSVHDVLEVYLAVLVVILVCIGLRMRFKQRDQE